MKRLNSLNYGCSCILLASLLTAGGAAAQTPEDDADGATPMRLGNVVIVARRSEELLQDVPLSVTALSADMLESVEVDSGSDLIKLVPSLNIQQATTQPEPQYSLRGIRTGVITYFNETPVVTSAVDDQIWDLSSVQALAGPQGTLFGRNSTGGAILFVPQKPTDDLGGYVKGSYGNYNGQLYEGVLNLPVADAVKLRFGGRFARRDPVVENVNLEGSDYQSLGRDALRASALIDFTSSLSNYLVLDYSKRDEKPVAFITSPVSDTAGCFPGIGCLYGDLPAQQGAVQDALGIRELDSSYPATQKSEQWGASNILSFEATDNLQFKYVLGYRKRAYDQQFNKVSIDLPMQVGRNYLNEGETITHELQVLSSFLDGRLDMTAGVFSSEETIDFGLSYSLFGDPTLPFSNDRNNFTTNVQETKSRAIYTQASFAVTDRLNATAGVRYTEDEAEIALQSRGPMFTFFGPQICRLPVGGEGVDSENCIRNIGDKYNATTYTASLDYRFNEDLLVYATTRRGYNGGGFNTSVPASNDPGAPQSTYSPETITDYEIGAKSNFSVGGLSLLANLSLFLAEYDDIQRQTFGVSSSNQTYIGISNGPKATIYGAQLETAAQLTPELLVSANYGYLHTGYDEGSLGFPKGNAFAQAPEHTVNLLAGYRRPLAGGADFVANASYAYQSEISFQDNNLGSEYAFQEGYGLVDLSVGLDNLGGELGVKFFIKNVTDEAYALERQDLLASFGFVGTVYNDPRTYGVELNYAFGGASR